MNSTTDGGGLHRAAWHSVNAMLKQGLSDEVIRNDCKEHIISIGNDNTVSYYLAKYMLEIIDKRSTETIPPKNTV